MSDEQDNLLDDLLDDDIPVIDKSGKKRLVRGAEFVDHAPAPPPAAAPPAGPVTEKSVEETASSEPETPAESESLPVTEPPAKPLPKFETAGQQFEKDEKEIKEVREQHQSELADNKAAEQTETKVVSVESDAIALSGLTFDDEDMKKRFRAIADTYFRGLRDDLETKSKMTMQVMSGGMGLDDAEADRVMKLFKSRFSEFQGAMISKAKKEKEAHVATQAEKQLKERDIEEAKEKESLDKRFASLMDKGGVKSKAAPAVPAPQPPPPAEPKKISVVGLDEKTEPEKKEEMKKDASKVLEPAISHEKKAATAALSPIPPKEPPTSSKQAPPPSGLPGMDGATKPPAASPAPPASKPTMSPPAAPKPPAPQGPPPPPAPKPISPLPKPMAPKPAPPVPKMQATPPKPAPPKPQSGAPGAGTTEKKVVSDVKYVPKLTGPIEELQSISVQDFHRLSKDPKEATLKIKDKIEALQERSFELKAEGIKAWQDSETNKIYLDILRRSLEGKPINEVIAEMENSGETTLSKSDFDAIMQLNRELRFG